MAHSTERLGLRSFHPEDANETFAAITPGLARFMSWEPPSSVQAFGDVWASWVTAFSAGTDLHVTVRREADGEFLGLVGMHGIGREEPELGIWIKEAAQGLGFGREAVAGLACWAADRLGVRVFVYPAAEANVASRRLIESLGGTVVASRATPKYNALLYRLSECRHGPGGPANGEISKPPKVSSGDDPS